MRASQQPKLLFANGPGYDDVASVLRRMGSGFECAPAEECFNADPNRAILFLNCGGSFPFSARVVRHFLEAGGTAYFSDLQAGFAAQVLPDIFAASESFLGGVHTACVVDPGLEQTLGASIPLRFDRDDWQCLLPRRSRYGTVYISMSWQDRAFFGLVRKPVRILPIVLSYEVPQGGALFFTAFHNVAQESSQAEALLRFLLFRPIMARDLRLTRAALRAKGLGAHREFTSGLRAGAPTATFSLESVGCWRASLSWQAQAKLRLRLVDVRGGTISAQESWIAPLAVSALAADGARVVVECMEFGQREVPFCLVVAREA